MDGSTQTIFLCWCLTANNHLGDHRHQKPKPLVTLTVL